MIYEPNMLLIGSSGRNSGKTVFACDLIRRFGAEYPVVAAKVTTIQDREGACPRGGEGCGVCAALEGRYCVTEETVAGTTKDTQRLLAAGARKAYWLRARKEHLAEGAEALLEVIGPDRLIVCESNSLRIVVDPQLFLMVRPHDASDAKASAERVQAYADQTILFDGTAFNLDPEDLGVQRGQWTLRYEAAAVILAGGKSERMGRDKGLLDVDGRPLIEHIRDRLAPHFRNVLLSVNDGDRYAFTDLKIVCDRVPNEGPLMAIASALEASPHDANLIVACDIPEVPIRLLRRMVRAVRDCDVAVPVFKDGHIQPLCAVYRKSALPALDAALAEGKRDVVDTVRRCNTRFVQADDSEPLTNLNTPDDYTAFVSQPVGQEC